MPPSAYSPLRVRHVRSGTHRHYRGGAVTAAEAADSDTTEEARSQRGVAEEEEEEEERIESVCDAKSARAEASTSGRGVY
eukprot:4154-Prorocentrum_minimum.AAC.1